MSSARTHVCTEKLLMSGTVYKRYSVRGLYNFTSIEGKKKHGGALFFPSLTRGQVVSSCSSAELSLLYD